MPSPDRSLILVWIVAYVLATLAIGLWSARRTRDQRDFFLAGQRLGLLVTGLTTMSAAFSGVVFLGGPGLMYRMGVGSLFICMPVGITAGLLCWLVAKRLRLLAMGGGVLTLPDAIRRRFRSAAAGGAAALAVLVGSVGYLAAQLLALGIVLELILGWSLGLSVTAGLLVICVYSMAGGMVAGVWTDLFQGVLMILAASAVWWLSIGEAGGIDGMVASISASEQFGPEFFEPFGAAGVVGAASLFLVFSVGTLGQPQMLHKLMMVRDLERMRWLPLVLGGSQTVCLLVWLGLGLAVPALVARGELAALASPDQAAPAFLLARAPDAMAGLVLAGVVAAIMSTADSFLNIAAGAVVRDLPRALGRRPAEGLRVLRLAIPGIGVAAAILALGFGDLIALLGTFAFGTFAAALAPVLAIGLNWQRVTGRAATASILTGTVVAVGLEVGARASGGLDKLIPVVPGVLPAVVALAVSVAVLLAVSLLDRRPAEDDPLVEAILSA
jgi:SSS family transporter